MNLRTRKLPGSRAPNEIDRLVGAKLRTARHDSGRTLHDVAGEVGVSHQQLQKYETGTNRISAGMLPGLAQALGIDVMDFFEDADVVSAAKRTPADKVRSECEAWLRRTKSEESLRGMLRVLKALAR